MFTGACDIVDGSTTVTQYHSHLILPPRPKRLRLMVMDMEQKSLTVEPVQTGSAELYTDRPVVQLMTSE